MTKHQVAKDPSPPANTEPTVCQPLTRGVIVLGTDFKSRRHERVYDADKIWSGEHTILDYTEVVDGGDPKAPVTVLSGLLDARETILCARSGAAALLEQPTTQMSVTDWSQREIFDVSAPRAPIDRMTRSNKIISD